jgi:tricorn protease
MNAKAVVAVCLFGLLLAAGAHARVSARMLRYPDVSSDRITFVYAGDIWVVPKEGGGARRLSSPPGEETFPRFSPDGGLIAYSANYDGNEDVYVVPAEGGLATRITHHPAPDRLVDWYPDGESLLYATTMKSGSQRFNQLYRTSSGGGLPEKLPLAYGEFAAVSPDGSRLAFQTLSREFRTWKRYRGGTAPDIWLFDFEERTAENVTESNANDSLPMWFGSRLYFLSDRGANQRANLWVRDEGTIRQVTRFDDYDVHFPAVGPSDIVFEVAGRLYRLELPSERLREVTIEVTTDHATLRPRSERVGGLIETARLSPTGKRAVVEARGEVFTLPAEHGPILNLTRSSGVAERHPAWSPDGRSIAYWSDASGEYELVVRPADGSGEEHRLTTLGPGYRYDPYWSPDSRKIAFIDKALAIQVYDFASDRVVAVDKALSLTHGTLAGFEISWSADCRWLAWAGDTEGGNFALFVYDTERQERHQLTSGFFNDTSPTFDPTGRYLYYFSNRTFEPSYSAVDEGWAYANATNLVTATLRKDVPSPLAPRNDREEPGAARARDGDEEDPGGRGEEKEGGARDEATAVAIDLDGFEQRAVVLPIPAGNYFRLRATPEKVVYGRGPRTGADDEQSSLVYWDLEEREEKSVRSKISSFEVSADGRKVLVIADGDDYRIVDLEADPRAESPLAGMMASASRAKKEKPLRIAELETTVDPVAEWRQIFADVWRLERDYFYDPGMHGVDWLEMRRRYGSLLDDVVTRWDLNYVLGELIAELNASHAYRSGGDTERAPERSVGLLGADFEIADGHYRIAHIVDGAPWDLEVRSPLHAPGVDVAEGEYLLAVNGQPLDVGRDPWAAFQGLGGASVVLSINHRPSLEGAREVLVETLSSETRLRNLDWIERNRRRVEEATDGRIGYLYVPNTGVGGQNELVRQFQGQLDRDGLIIDERFNSGGQYPNRFIELLDRRLTGAVATRDGIDRHISPAAFTGPRVMLINAWAGSGGDLFPYLFREAELGPLVGTRTWGGLIGISGVPGLIDGGRVTVPTLALFNQDGWLIEGHGVEPDIEVVDHPAQMLDGGDPQLDRAIEVALELLAAKPPTRLRRPAYDRRTPEIPSP